MNNLSQTRPSEKGGAFLYILLAISLFMALSYMMSQSNRSADSSLTAEQTKIAAQEIIDYGNAIAAAVQKLKLRGCADTEISLANAVYTLNNGTLIFPDGHNPNAPTNESCDVFKSGGAALIAQLIPVSYTENWPGIGPHEFQARNPVVQTGRNTRKR